MESGRPLFWKYETDRAEKASARVSLQIEPWEIARRMVQEAGSKVLPVHGVATLMLSHSSPPPVTLPGRDPFCQVWDGPERRCLNSLAW